MIYYTLSNSPSGGRSVAGQARPAAGRGDDEPPKYQYFTVLSKSEEHSGLMRIEGGVDSPTAMEAYGGKENILIVKDIVYGPLKALQTSSRQAAVQGLASVEEELRSLADIVKCLKKGSEELKEDNKELKERVNSLEGRVGLLERANAALVENVQSSTKFA